MEMRRFKVVNTTVKPKRICPKTGRDLRETVEKVGHAVQFRDNKDSIVSVPVSRSRIIDEKDVTSQLLNLRRGGFVHIEVIEDIVEELKKYSIQKAADKHALRHNGERPIRARAIEMGKDDHSQKGGSEHEDAVNPDGNPDFVAQAPAINPQNSNPSFSVTAKTLDGGI